MDNDHKTFLERRALGCSEIEELLDSYIDGEMPLGMVGRFEQHVHQCDACNSLVEDCQHIVEMAKSLAEVKVPEGVRSRLRAALKEQVGHDVEKSRARLTLVKS
ncbi:MAG: zf-HC2 domain-containing protein [Bdellovibrionota bacterium]